MVIITTMTIIAGTEIIHVMATLAPMATKVVIPISTVMTATYLLVKQ